MQKRPICAGGLFVDLAMSTLGREPMLRVIAFGATATKCGRQWKTRFFEIVMSKKD